MASVSLSDPLQFTKKEAEKILREEAVHKDFWAVNDYQDNCERLQALIDALFNIVEGNNYNVDYQENQNGTRLVVVCKVCCKELTSYDPFIAHENGKPHKKVRNKSLAVDEPNLESLELQPHNKPRGTFPEDTIEDQIDCTDCPVLGLQFVYKEKIDNRETFAYTCQLCQGSADVRQVSSTRMFSHLTSIGHNQKYLEVKFGYLKTSTKEFWEECRAIEEFEGKIHTNIVDLTIEKPYDKPKEDRHSLPPRSPSPPRREKKSKMEPVEPKEEVKPVHQGPEMCDAAVSADITSEARFILHEINALQDIDCLMTLQEDEDMQDLLKETLWELAGKMERYYARTGETYPEGEKKTPTLLSKSAKKVKQYVAELAELK